MYVVQLNAKHSCTCNHINFEEITVPQPLKMPRNHLIPTQQLSLIETLQNYVIQQETCYPATPNFSGQ